jgi:hypothetical protein
VGTVLYALAVGPVTQFFLPWFACRSAAEPGGETVLPEERNPAGMIKA